MDLAAIAADVFGMAHSQRGLVTYNEDHKVDATCRTGAIECL